MHPRTSRPVSPIRNVLANWGAFLLSAAAGLFLSPFIVSSLGTTGYGLWAIVGSLTGALGVFDLGMRSAVVRFVSREHARGDHEAASTIASALNALFAGAGVLVVIVGVVIVMQFSRWFAIPADLVAPGKMALTLSVLALALSLVNSVQAGVLMAMERLDILGLSDLAFEGCRILMLLVLLNAGTGIVGLASVGLVLGIARYVVIGWSVRRVYPELRMTMRRPSREEIAKILDVSAFSTVIYTSVTLAAQAGTLILGAYVPVTLVTFYAIGSTLPDYAISLNRPIAQSVHPRASRLDATGDAKGLREMILTFGKYSVLVLLPVVLTFQFRGHTFIDIWQGSAFAGPAGSVLAILSMGSLFAGPRHVMQAAFVGSGRHRVLGVWYVGEAIVRILLTVLLVRWRGIQGAAWASVAPGIVMAIIVIPVLCLRYFGIPPMTLLRRVWGIPFFAMLPFAAATIAVDHWWPARGYLLFFAQVAFLMPLAIIGAFLFGLDACERALVLAPVRSRLAVFSRARVPTREH